MTVPNHCMKNFLREDIHFIGVPLMEICNREFTDPRQKQLFKNIVYVGAIARLFNIETSVIENFLLSSLKVKKN
jgi:2-oxoglutarate/2-oxoacid ferredoxin oxidoreductase subunit alpha